jgi:TonB-linked SusC/RagA family outer membrane protein
MRKIILSLLVLFAFVFSANAQDRTVTGKVTDALGNPLPNVTVMVKNTKVGATTGSDGFYSISIPSKGRILVFSSVDMTPEEIVIGSKSVINPSLKSNERSLQEVVVTGYTREKKSQFSGAATVLSSRVVENVPVAAFDQMLQGRVPGLLANSSSGQPGASAFIRLRGTSSIGGQGNPLFIVDGIPLAGGDMATINPNDFESITVLKDAAASALYGARGALGVIVITTKRGRAGQTNFTFRTQYGFTERPSPSKFDQMNSKEMLAYEEFVGGFSPSLTAPGWAYSAKNPANANLPATSPASTPYSASLARYSFLLDSLGNNNVDYYDLLFKTGITKTNELNMSGGTANSRYFVSLNNFDQEGTDRKSKLNRYTLRFNLDNTAGKLTTQLSSTVGYSKTDYNEGTFYAASGTANPFAMVWRSKPYEKPLLNGVPTVGTSTPTAPKALGNLIERSDNTTWIDKQFKVNAGLSLAYKIIPQVTLKNNVGVDASYDYGQGAINANSYVGSLQTYQAGYLNESVFNRLQLINTSGIIFNDKFGEKHDLEVGGYFEAIRQWNNGIGFTIYNLDPRLTQTGQNAGTIPIVAGTTTIAQNGSSAKSGFGIRSVFGNLRYTYNDRYTITGNIRRDGTSRIIDPVNKQLTTYSAGFIWDAIKEPFLKNQKVVSSLRVRGTYGEVPNIGSIPGGGSYGVGSNFFSVPRYLGAQLPAFAAVNFAGSSITAQAPTVANPDLRIETVEKTNIGMDLGFVKNRIRLSVDVYKNVTKDLFVSQTLPATSGFYGTSLSVNAGTMSNKGIELDLGLDVIRTENMDFTLRANHSINKNKIEDLGSVTEYPSGTGIIKKGLPFGTHYSYAYLGADPASGKPIYKRPDGTPTTNINEAGQFHEFGTYIPVQQGGFSGTIRFHQFTLDAFFSYQFDVRRYNNIQNWVTQGDATYTGAVTQSRVMLTDQWRQPGDVKMLQSPAYSRQFTSYDISDASFIRFRNLNVSYTIPELKAGKSRLIKSSRFYIQGQNLAIWSPWSGLDPEDDNNISLGEFPNPRAVVVGVDINF